MNLSTTDASILVIYFVIVFIIGFIFTSKQKNITDYFLAGRNMSWYIVGAAMFASNISSEHYLGLASSGYYSGIAVAVFELSAVVLLLILGWWIVPYYINSKIFTTPEFIEKRFNRTCRLFLSVLSILAYVLTKISVTLFAGGIVLMNVFGLDLYTSCLLLVLATGIYTIAGSGVVFNIQLLQTIIMIVGASVLTIIGLYEVGGFEVLKTKVPENYFSIFRSYNDPEFPWPGAIFGTLILGFWYWNTDQFIVQRVLAAKNIPHARSGALLTGFLKLLPIFILVVPGIIAKALFPDIPPDEAFSTMLITLLPSGVKGLVVAAFLAALMSSLASCFNTSSTLFTMDIYRNLYPHANEFVLLNIGRIATLVIVIFGIIWVPFISYISDHIWMYLQSVQAYFSPALCVIFLFGIFWKRATSTAALTVLITGTILGFMKFILEIFCKDYPFTLELMNQLVKMNFLYFSIVLFVICILLMIVVSLLTLPSSEEKLQVISFREKNIELNLRQSFFTSKKFHIAATILILGLLSGILLVFR